MKIKILFPSDFFDCKKVDGFYQDEYNAVIQLQDFEPVIFNYEVWISECKLKLFPLKLNQGLCIYRGWMLKPEKYNKLYMALKQIDIELINSPMEYEKCHLFPNVYSDLKNYTPKTIWFEDHKKIDLNCINSTFKKFIIKDYVKSVKGTTFPKYFNTHITKEEITNYINQFIELRDSLYTGGIVFKEYVDLMYYNNYTNEYRVFYLNEHIISCSRNSNQPNSCPMVPMSLIKKFTELKSNFYTVDFAELNNRDWIIIETGDGQVSGLSPNQYIFKFYEEIMLCLNSSDRIINSNY